MKILGVEFQSDQTIWVLLEFEQEVVTSFKTGFIKIGDTKSQESMRQYQFDVAKLFSGEEVAKIGVKDKPESGRMRAGAAAMKMEAIFLLTAGSDVTFLSSRAVAKAMELAPDVKEKYKDAYRTAVAISKV